MTVNTQEKRNKSKTIKPKTKAKSSRGDEVVMVETGIKPRSKSRPGTKKETDNPEGLPRQAPRPRSRPPTHREGGASSPSQPTQPEPEQQPESTPVPKSKSKSTKYSPTKKDHRKR